MRKRLAYLMLVICLLLTACSSQKKSEKQQTEPSTKQTSGSQDREESATLDKQVHYNGSYYYVEGKEGQIPVVNKRYPLAADYNPGENAKAKAQLLELIAAMQAAGFPISDQYSGFRSYQAQSSLYQDYVNRDGKEAADRYSARPGYSEHQTGLAYDLIDQAGNLLTEEKASQWLLQHAGQYGFVVRYLNGKEAVTGYMPEQWHLRYIGSEAQDIAASGLTLEEYYGFSGGDYQE
ncbi:LD-carboxypeptidase LdcB/DacB [Streptococcus oricebi]|uniref:D-alanyl-D-alanine carboxypeptidase n=1 Tax=Streptococcus oricebi TaxID=1547447 RepID=A0ABS5B3A5_9STRE|nr:LD-carboxypeptidase LdcB/DacB [Streptococcus oricebi]MBP2622444.1 D-alanyl-D-alanine carboxypeptidase [Streptococcus oricebi]